MGIQTVGAGADIAEARRPARFDIRGVRVGVLGYGSVLRDGYWATEHQAGVAPMRAHTYYEAQEYQAGTPPRVITVPFAEDVAAMRDDIDHLRPDVDVVIVSFHWGVHHIPKVLADYQRIVAREVFAAGGDLIVGHHTHVPKAIEVIDGKVCFHSLANFMFTTSEKGKDKPGHRFSSGSKYGIPLDPDYPRLPFGRDGQRSLIAQADLTRDGVQRVSFVPVQIDTQYRPEILRPADPRFDEAVRYLEDVSSEVEHTFTVDGDEVVVTWRNCVSRATQIAARRSFASPHSLASDSRASQRQMPRSWPPQTLMAWPVMKSASLEHRKATTLAWSSGRPGRPRAPVCGN